MGSITDSDSSLYTVAVSKELGRYLIASRDIEPWEVIISEDPFLSAPSDSTSEAPSCLGCCICMLNDPFNRCSLCFWPVCSLECQQAASHAENECRLFRANKAVYPPPFTKPILNKSIMVLRALLLKTERPEAWAQLLQMESHLELRKNKPNCLHSDEKIIKNIRTFWGISSQPEDDEIRRISGIIDANAHVLPQRVTANETAGVCHIFRKTSLLSHSCCPNAAWSPHPTCDSQLVTRASIRIQKGEEIRVCYDVGEILYGTLRRLIPMEITGLFTCSCKRCSDPTELGTNLSTLICTNCRVGYVTSQCPTDSFSDWECEACHCLMSDETVLDIMEELELQIGFPKYNVLFDSKPESVSFLENFLKLNSRRRLHPNHYILQEVKLRIIKQNAGRLRDLDPAQLLSLISACEDLLQTSNIIYPGFSEYRAILLFHLWQGLREQEARKKINEEDGDAEMRNKLNEIRAEALIYFKDNYGYEKYSSQIEADACYEINKCVISTSFDLKYKCFNITQIKT